MRVTLLIPDEMYETYREQAKDKTPAGVREEIKDRLRRFASVPSLERPIVLYGETRRALEEIAGATINDPKGVVNLFRNLCTVKIAGVDHHLTEDELVRIREQALFHGQTPEEYIKNLITEFFAPYTGRF